MCKQEIKLGNKVRDIVTGFEGIATAKIEYLNGCIQYCVKPKTTDGKMPEGEYIDHQQLDVINGGIEIDSLNTGGDNNESPRFCGLSKN